MEKRPDYVLGQSEEAARRLAIQDTFFAEPSEKLLDALKLRPGDRVVELGCGAGSFSRRVLRRLGAGGVLVGVDSSASLLEQAQRGLAQAGAARFEPVLADIAQPGPWLQGADAVVARTVLHHVPLAELLLGRLRALLPAGTRLGLLEPDFRAPLARLAYLQEQGRPELAVLATWALAINHLYQARLLSPALGATLAAALELAGCRNVQAFWAECPSDGRVIDNMIMFYDEVRDRLADLHILSAAEVDEQQRLLRALPRDRLPAVWGSFGVTALT